METFKNILEIIYFISGPLLVIIAYRALSQIKVAKEQIEAQQKATQINAKRDSLKTTSEQIAKYGSEIIPLSNNFDKKIASEKIDFFKKSKITITNKEISIKPCTDEAEQKKLILVVNEFTQLMNAMEGFSIYFTSGVADETVAFRSLSSTFCNTIEELLPILIPMMDGENRFNATLKLFHIWHTRLETENLEKQKEALTRKLATNKPQSIEVIGSAI